MENKKQPLRQALQRFGGGLMALVLLAAPLELRAAFKDPGFGARPHGMGKAFVAISDDANAILHNPAGATQISGFEMSLAYANPFAGLDDVGLKLNHFSSYLPVRDLGTLGVSWSRLDSDALDQNTATFLLAAPVNRWFPDLIPSVFFGGNLQYYHQSFDLDARTRNDSVFSSGRSEAAVGFDLGFLIRPDPRILPGLTLGVTGKALNEPEIGLAEKEKIHRELIVGAAYRFTRLILTLDGVYRDEEAEWRAGGELWFRRRTLGLRGGAHSSAATMGLSYILRTKRWRALSFDYAFSIPFFLEDSGGSHRVSFGVQF